MKKACMLFCLAVSLGLNCAWGETKEKKNGIDSLKNVFLHGDSIEQRKAGIALRDGGDKSISVLCDIIEGDVNYASKQHASRILEEVVLSSAAQSEETLSKLERIARKSDPGVSAMGAMAIMHFKGSMRARKILKESALAQPNEQHRAQIIGAYVFNITGDRKEIPVLTEFMKDDSEYVRVSVAGYLGTLGDKRGLPICKEVLERKPVNDKTKILQMRAAIAAGRIGDQGLLPILKKVAASRDYGLAQWQARTAVKEIEYATLTGKGRKLEYLKNALREEMNVRWAVQKLIAINDSESMAILKWAANEKDLAGALEARFTLSALGATKAE